MNRDHTIDFVKLTAAWTAWFFAVQWGALAAFASFVFTGLLILDKIGLLAPLKAWCAEKYQAFRARQRGQGGPTVNP